MKNLICLTAIVIFVCSCATKQRILNASSVSMTKYSLKKGQKLKEIGEVIGEYCTEIKMGGSTTGLLDEAIKNAQKKSNADFLTNATFYSKGNCVTVEALAMKIKK